MTNPMRAMQIAVVFDALAKVEFERGDYVQGALHDFYMIARFAMHGMQQDTAAGWTPLECLEEIEETCREIRRKLEAEAASPE